MFAEWLNEGPRGLGPKPQTGRQALGGGADVRLLNAPWALEQRSEDGDSHGSEQVGGEETQRQAPEEEAETEADAWGATFPGPLWQGPSSPLEAPQMLSSVSTEPQSRPIPTLRSCLHVRGMRKSLPTDHYSVSNFFVFFQL